MPEQTQKKKTKISSRKAAPQTRPHQVNNNDDKAEGELRVADEDHPHANQSDCDGTLYFESVCGSDLDQNLPKERLNDIWQDINRDLVRAQHLH